MKQTKKIQKQENIVMNNISYIASLKKEQRVEVYKKMLKPCK